MRPHSFQCGTLFIILIVSQLRRELSAGKEVKEDEKKLNRVSKVLHIQTL